MGERLSLNDVTQAKLYPYIHSFNLFDTICSLFYFPKKLFSPDTVTSFTETPICLSFSVNGNNTFLDYVYREKKE